MPATIEKTSAEDLAKAFAEVLKTWLTKAEMKAVVAENKKNNDSTCASHDYCDANMAMDEAMQVIAPKFYKAAWADNEKTEGEGKLWSDFVDLFNAAWGIAKAADFYIKGA